MNRRESAQELTTIEPARRGLWRKIQAGDPVQRQAAAHIHSDVTNIVERRAAFREADPNVRIHVIAQLRALATTKQGFNVGPATGALVAAVLASATIFATFFVTSWSGFYSALVKMMDAHTGKVSGISEAQFDKLTYSLAEVLGLFVLTILVVAWGAWKIASRNDVLRGAYTAWLALFEEDFKLVERSRLGDRDFMTRKRANSRGRQSVN